MGKSPSSLRAFNIAFGLMLTLGLTGAAFGQNGFASSAQILLHASHANAQAAAEPEVVETKTGAEAVVPPDQVIKVANDLNEVSDDEFFASLANAFGQTHGASVLVVLGLIVQLLIQFTKTRLFGQIFKKVDARGKLTIVLVLTSVTTFLGLMTQGMGWVAAATSGAFMSSAMVAGHQVYKLFLTKDPNKNDGINL